VRIPVIVIGHSGRRWSPVPVIMITPSGHPEGRREGRGDLRRRHECKLHSQSVLVKRQSLVQAPAGSGPRS